MTRDARTQLIDLLQMAYSAEKAAAYAYEGHWHSVKSSAEREAIQKIEQEEWHHRRLVGELLEELGSAPSRAREIRSALIGRVLGALCHVSGWLAPMYGAGRLERRNIGEYEAAARLAVRSGNGHMIDCLLMMAEVEWEHEQYFRARVLSHRLGARLPIWPAPPPKSAIREAFEPAPVSESAAPAAR